MPETTRTLAELLAIYADNAVQAISAQDGRDFIFSVYQQPFFVAANNASQQSKDRAHFLCDGTADNVQIQAALDALPSTGGRVILSEGTFDCTTTITRNDRSFVIEGQGPEQTIVKFTGCNGLDINTNSEVKVVEVRNLTLATASNGTYVALRLEGDDSASNSNHQFRVDNVMIRPFDIATNWWLKGIVVVEGWHSHIRDVYIRGKSNTLDMETGVELNSQTIVFNIDNLTCHFMVTGLHVQGAGPEGTYLTNFTAVLVTYGIRCTTSGLQLQWIGGHVDARTRGIILNGCPQSTIQGVLFYKRSESTENFVHIELDGGSHDTRIIGCTLRGAGTSGSDNGIVLTGDDRCTIIGNSISDCDGTGIWLKTGSDNNCIVGNTGGSNGDGILDQGTGNVLSGNVLT